MSKIEVNTVEPQCGTTLTVGKTSGSVRTAANNIQAADGGNLISQCGATITLGASGDTITLASGASQTGFGRTGTVDWQTGSIKTATFTAVSGEGYFANTNGGAFNMNLPAGSAGAIVSVLDYNNSFATSNLTIVPNGSDKINGVAQNAALSTNGQSVTLIYVDSTRGWKNSMDSTSDITGTSGFVQATGGNTTLTCGDFKTHIFTSPGSFVATDVGLPSGSTTVEYVVVAGGGAGKVAGYGGGGGGGGGFRTTYPSPATGGFPIIAQSYPITVGAGGAASPTPSANAKGSSSIFSSITSAGGGGGSGGGSATDDNKGGSGGGAGGAYAGGPATPTTGAAGNFPPVSPPQGNNGGNGRTGVGGCAYYGGGGGGAGAVGGNNPGPANGGDGAPIADAFFGPTAPSYGTPGPSPGRYFAGGGGGQAVLTSSNGSGGAGGGSAGKGPPGPQPPTDAGGTNTGGGSGGGGGYPGPTIETGAGGSGIVMIRYKFQ